MGVYLEAAKKIRAVMDKAAGMLTDEQAAQVTALFPGWDAAATYAVGQGAHRSQRRNPALGAAGQRQWICQRR